MEKKHIGWRMTLAFQPTPNPIYKIGLTIER